MALINIDPKDILFDKILYVALDHNNKRIEDVELIDRCDNWDEKVQNFYSNITRFQLKYTCIDDICNERIDEYKFFILKEEPLEKSCLMQVRQSKFFETEINILQRVIPKIENLIDKQIAPKFIYGSKIKSLIVMEDLVSDKFISKECKLGFSKSHILIVIETLAKFHAGSVALNEKEPGILSQFNRYDISNSTHKNIFKNIEFCTRAIGKVFGNLSNDEKCAKTALKFQKLSKEISERLLNITKYDADEFCVLNHGDCWTNNIMFREDGHDKPIDIRLIDFQISVWSSPTIDLLFLLSVCPELNIKYKYDDFFLQEYLNILIVTMKNLGCKTKPPTFDELKSSMYKRRSFAVKCGLIFYSKLVAGNDHIETIEDILKNGRSDPAIFNHPKTIEALKKIVPLMDNKGYLD